jgi:flagella basal body P-ring formation protein FlgA
MRRLLLTRFRLARLLLAVCGLLGAFCLAAPAHAATPLADAARQFAQREAMGAVAHPAARVEVAVGQIDPRFAQAQCARLEAFLPAGARAWGRASVGLRCLDGAPWTVLVPVTVRIWGPALVASRPLAAGITPAADDLREAEVEWTREPQGVVTDAAQIGSRVLMRPLAMGQPLPLAALRAAQVVAAGDPVKIVGQGRGFAVSADAIALAAATDGQPVRVRTDSGKILTGTARSGRRVEVVF